MSRFGWEPSTADWTIGQALFFVSRKSQVLEACSTFFQPLDSFHFLYCRNVTPRVIERETRCVGFGCDDKHSHPGALRRGPNSSGRAGDWCLSNAARYSVQVRIIRFTCPLVQRWPRALERNFHREVHLASVHLLFGLALSCLYARMGADDLDVPGPTLWGKRWGRR